MIYNNFPIWENFECSNVTSFKSRMDTNEIISTKGHVKYFDVVCDSTLKYNYEVSFHYQTDSNWLHQTTILYDGKNYLRLRHDHQGYVLGDGNHTNVHTFWGNVFTVRELIGFVAKADSFEHSIYVEDKTGQVNIEIKFDSCRMHMDIPVKVKAIDVMTKIVNIRLDSTYFPLELRETWIHKKKTGTTYHLFEKPIQIAPQVISVADSIPEDYDGRMESKKKLKGNISKTFPKYELPSIDNESIYSNDALKGKVVLYDFFSLYCGPCLLATEDLVKLKQNIPSDNFEIICVDAVNKSKMNSLIKYRDKKNVNYPVLMNGKELYHEMGCMTLPTFVLVDKNNNIVDITTGYSKKAMGELNKKILDLI
ncbi:MAG: TlpA family protein disulfide reductase [Bacteroidales bacterium]|nr:TlpA family protein disulfide reductase [Bacteroidales bacterium]